MNTPFAIQRILVPIDFSDCAKKALQYALPLARQHQAVLTLLCVVEPSYGGGEFGAVDYVQLDATLKEGAEQQLSKLAAEEVPADVRVETAVRLGTPVHEIIDAAKKLPADLIVISTHGRTGLKHVFLGSVTEHVVQRAPCPVFVVREREHEILA